MSAPFHLALKMGKPRNTFYSETQPALALSSILVVGRSTIQMEKHMVPKGTTERTGFVETEPLWS